MKRTLCLLLSSLMLLCALSGCGESRNASSAGPEDVPVGVGIYTFTELAMGGDLIIPFTVELLEDGSYTVTEENPANGNITYTGASYVWKDTYFTTEKMDGTQRPEAGWFEEDGSCVWIITGEGEVTPMQYVAPSGEDSAAGTQENAPGDSAAVTKADFSGIAYADDSASQVLDVYLPEGDSAAVTKADFSGIAYADDSASQVLDVYLPEGDGPFPVIVVFHGGGFKFGDQAMSILEPIFNATSQGYAVVSVDYRKSSEAPFPAAVADAKAAVRWVKANAAEYGFDAEKIAVWGESAGAYLAAMTALTPDVEALNGDVTDNLQYSSSVNALVDFYAPINFWEMDADSETLGLSANTGAAGSFESDFIGQAVSQDEEFTKQSWWGTYSELVPKDLHIWIQAGDSDKRVPCLQSEHFADELTQAGCTNVFFSYIEGADHEDALFYTEENLSNVYAFLKEALN